MMTFSGCGSASSSSQTQNTPETTNPITNEATTLATDKVIQNENDSSYTSDYKVENFTNANWLYQNYFGEYGLPQEFQSMIDIELKRLANGMALSQAYGDDMQEQMSKFDRTMKLFMQTTGIKEQIMSLKQDLENESINLENFPPAVDDNLTIQETQLIANDKDISQEIINQSAEDDKEFAVLIEKEKQLVKDHNLPYKLDGEYIKIMNPEDVIHEMDKWSDARDGAIEIVESVVNTVYGVITYVWEFTSSCIAGRSKHEDIGNWNWWDGDIIYARTYDLTNGIADSNRGILHMFSGGHIGLVLRSEGNTVADLDNPNIENKVKYKIFESHPGVDDGTHTETAWGTWREWTNSKERDYDKIQAYYNKAWGKHNSKRARVRDFALDKIGKKYSIFTGRYSTSKYYCSKLVWQAYKSQGKRLNEGGSVIRPDAIIRTSGLGRFQHSQKSACR
jgi:hypothetical protein